MNTVSPEKNKRKEKSIKRFFESFKNSYDGLSYAYRFEQSMTIHLIACIIVVALGIWLEIGPYQWLICLFALGLIAGIELINTAIEATVDLVTTDIHPLAKIAKDTASASVGLFSAMAFIAFCIIFIPKIMKLLETLVLLPLL